jgi:alkylation response protein AidB-like acyl-CoA dehydrogenase
MYRKTEEQQAAVDGLRRFLDEKLEPEIRKYDDQVIPDAKFREWAQQLSEFGVLTAPHPEEHGGYGMDWVTHLMLFEEVVYSSLDLAVPLLINVVAADLLIRLAPPELCERYVPDLLSGKKFASVGISEPDVGSDVAAVKAKAVRDGDHYVISGEKTWISSGRYADIFICTCRTEEGLSHILIDREEHGFETRDIKKIALNGQSTAQVFLNDVRVPVGNIIGDAGQALRQTLVVFERARCHVAVWGYAVGRRANDEAIKYSRERSQHGKLIAGHQLIADKIATNATKIDAARLLTLRAGAMIDAGERCDAECAMAKWYGTEIAITAARDALQIHGGNGVTKDFIIERLARESLIGPIPDGTTEIQKLIIARSLTGISAF